MSEQSDRQEDPLKQLILLLQSFYKEALRRWLFIVVFGFLFAGIGISVAILLPIEYEAKITFII
jgi:hypothetical protein